MRSLNIVNVVKTGGLDSSYVGIVLQQRGCSQVNADVDEVIHNNYYRGGNVCSKNTLIADTCSPRGLWPDLPTQMDSRQRWADSSAMSWWWWLKDKWQWCSPPGDSRRQRPCQAGSSTKRGRSPRPRWFSMWIFFKLLTAISFFRWVWHWSDNAFNITYICELSWIVYFLPGDSSIGHIDHIGHIDDSSSGQPVADNRENSEVSTFFCQFRENHIS